MAIKRTFLIICIIASLVIGISVSYAGEAVQLVEDFPTVQAYTDDPVDPDDLNRILNAGINAPSGLNSQPWHFSVVTDPEIIKDMASGGDLSSSTRASMVDAPVSIVVSCKDTAKFDAGLAIQTMSVEAQLLGYGSKIFVYPMVTINGERQTEFKEILGIPEDMTAVALLIVGVEDKNTDAVSAPTGRYPFDQMVSMIEPN